MLKADIQLRLSRLDLDAAFTVESGEVVALLGPNGSGKSTTLRALMGLLPLAGGQVVLDGTVLEDPAQHIKVPPENRPIGLMFQDYLLFPHLSAVENVAFGLRAKGADKKQARDRATQALERLGLEGALTSARPAAMSGGQQQRVAMARALVTEPKLLLLDDPDVGRGDSPGKARAVAAGPLDPDQGDGPEPAQPAEQPGVPGRAGRDPPRRAAPRPDQARRPHACPRGCPHRR